MSFTIEGIGSVPSNRAEYTSGAVLKKYLENVAVFKEVFDKRLGNSLVPSDFEDVVNALVELRDLALNGATDGNPPLTFYLTAEMAVNMDMIFKSLKAVGITPDSTGFTDVDKIELLRNWQSLAGFGVQALLNAAANVSTNSTRTLQSMVELEYIKQGNDLLALKFTALEESLRVTQGILDSLGIVQGISNQITVTNRGNFAFPPKTDADIPSAAIGAIQSALIKILSDATPDVAGGSLTLRIPSFTQSFNNSITAAKAAALANGTTLSVELGQLTAASDIINDVIGHDWSDAAAKGVSVESITIQYYTQIYKAMASAQFRQVFPIATPTSTAATELVAAKQKLYERLLTLEEISPANTRSVEGTLANFVYKVVLDISNAFKNINPAALTPTQLASALKSAVSTWIIDNQDQKISSSLAVQTGSIQDRITQAIKAAQSLNDTEKENVRNYQFVFEQFYKSASAVLQKVTQIIEKMAQGIGR
ncbi:MAG: hypothetical protein LW832_08545 [Parachlamydia sp.]|jgi:hypothetical protein|nr:hypothetical protein [Parachlamydia sp.]